MNINECDGGACATSGPVSMNLQTNVNGIGNAVLPSQAAMTGQDQSSKDCIGSGDRWDGFSKKSKSDKKKKYLLGIATQKGVEVLESVESYLEASRRLQSYSDREIYNNIKIYAVNA